MRIEDMGPGTPLVVAITNIRIPDPRSRQSHILLRRAQLAVMFQPVAETFRPSDPILLIYSCALQGANVLPRKRTAITCLQNL